MSRAFLFDAPRCHYESMRPIPWQRALLHDTSRSTEKKRKFRPKHVQGSMCYFLMFCVSPSTPSVVLDSDAALLQIHV